MSDELRRILSQPTTQGSSDLIPDFSDSGPVVGFLGGVYSLAVFAMIVIPIIVCLAPLIPFALLFVIGAGIDKCVKRVSHRRSRRHL